MLPKRDTIQKLVPTSRNCRHLKIKWRIPLITSALCVDPLRLIRLNRKKKRKEKREKNIQVKSAECIPFLSPGIKSSRVLRSRHGFLDRGGRGRGPILSLFQLEILSRRLTRFVERYELQETSGLGELRKWFNLLSKKLILIVPGKLVFSENLELNASKQIVRWRSLLISATLSDGQRINLSPNSCTVN